MMLKIERRYFPVLLTLVMLCSCGSNTPQQRPQPPMPVQTITPGGQAAPIAPLVSQQDSFSLWVNDFKREALTKGISQPVLDDAFAHVTAPAPAVVKLDQTQPEKTRTFADYLKGFLKQEKVDAAQDQWQSHEELLGDVEKAYGVPAPILLSLWEIESRFGQHQGSYSIIQSLSTLAYDGRRSAFFRSQLLDALTILQQEHMPAASLTGSWAGAMGQTQFMPSSYLSFAVDFDGDGKKDIWNSDADALASMANYLHTRGWNYSIGWGFHVRLPRGLDVAAWVASKEKHPLKVWSKLGIHLSSGAKLPRGDYEARLIMPDDDTSNAYLVTSNYDVIMDWNHSTYFATSVCLLADAVGKR